MSTQKIPFQKVSKNYISKIKGTFLDPNSSELPLQCQTDHYIKPVDVNKGIQIDNQIKSNILKNNIIIIDSWNFT